MNTFQRTTLKDAPVRSALISEAVIVSHMDPNYMGTLTVELISYRGSNPLPERTGQLMTVRYLSPFYGVTPLKGVQPNDAYRFTQQSYGFWAIPPDVGTRVLVLFAEGHAAYGYWIGCIPDEGMNFMVPDPRAVTELTTEATPDNLKGLKLPTGEYNKLLENGESIDYNFFLKPYNKDFTEVLEVQGLLYDETRGLSTSSARREAPSMVFGWSSPGPKDKRTGSPDTTYGDSENASTDKYSRLGGSSIVMDDGDDKLVRATHAADGPPYYVNKEIGEEGGDETIPQNEGIRIRTRTGHQILLSNSEDFIYIGNSRGTAWIELTSDGKIDIFANDSISVFSEQDFNFIAERDINLDAGRNINLFASGRWSEEQNYVGYNSIRSGEISIVGKNATGIRSGENSTGISFTNNDVSLKSANELRIETKNDFHIKSSSSVLIDAKRSIHNFAEDNIFSKSNSKMTFETANMFNQVTNDYNNIVGSNFKETIGSNKNSIITGNNNISINSNNNVSVKGDTYNIANGSLYNESSGNVYNIAGGGSYNSIGGDFNIQGKNINFDSAGKIVQNSNASLPSRPAQGALSPSPPSVAMSGGSPLRALGTGTPRKLDVFSSPRVIPGINEPLEISTICTRVPQHEPWTHHENLDPVAFKPENLDREIGKKTFGADRIVTPDTFRKSISGLQQSIIDTGTGGNFDVNGVIIAPALDQAGNVVTTTFENAPLTGATEEIQTGFGEGQVDPSLAAAAGIVSSPSTTGEAPPANFSGCDSRHPCPGGPVKGSSEGIITGINYERSRKRALNDKLTTLLLQAARYARVNIYVTSPGQNSRADGTGSVRHNQGFAADLVIIDEGRTLELQKSEDLGRVITFVRAFRDYARSSGEKPSGGAGKNYMGNAIHLDIAHDNSLTQTNSPSAYGTFAWGDSGSPSAAYCWMKAIMYGNSSNDGFCNSSGNVGIS